MPTMSIFQKFEDFCTLWSFFSSNIPAENMTLIIYHIKKTDVKAEKVEIAKQGQTNCVYHTTELNFQHRMNRHIKV